MHETSTRFMYKNKIQSISVSALMQILLRAQCVEDRRKSNINIFMKQTQTHFGSNTTEEFLFNTRICSSLYTSVRRFLSEHKIKIKSQRDLWHTLQYSGLIKFLRENSIYCSRFGSTYLQWNLKACYMWRTLPCPFYSLYFSEVVSYYFYNRTQWANTFMKWWNIMFDMCSLLHNLYCLMIHFCL